ncbi:endo alpha-1,4 polygalactosaminidase [Psychromonas sp. Urea-02u-13]|uniref:endo alpha-1,4 polygalactosaminidase n=1 Tax=Psychromonas sp. Urea-02u-13 TaxID=2058326 RepID=UPI001E3AE4F4|nr:endo alpha-1,4 polygalactosaminidase [Psychromonas sp. Urea-02u-13]
MAISGCNTEKGDRHSKQEASHSKEEVSQANLDPDIAAIIEGDWYRPALSVTWQWQLVGSINASYPVEIYDVDLYDTSLSKIQTLQASGNKVICYFSAGSYEDFREDKQRFLSEELGNTLDGWEDERWLDIRSSNVHAIMMVRLDLAKEKGCDGVEADNMDGYTNNSGFNLTATDQLAYNKFIANEAHKRALSVGLKNDLDQIVELVDYYDFAVNEQCFEYNECDTLFPFINNGKPVLNAEYLDKYVFNESERNALCTESVSHQFSTLIIPLDLNDEFRFSCL